MTVRHLRNLQRQQMTTALASDPNVVTKYRSGFNECAGEVMRYMNNSRTVPEEIQNKVSNHLSSCVQNVNSSSRREQSSVQKQFVQNIQPQLDPGQVGSARNGGVQTLLQPLSVQIPHQLQCQTNNTPQYSSSSSSSTSALSSHSISPIQQTTSCVLMPDNGNISNTAHANNNNNVPSQLLNIAPMPIDNKTYQIVPGNIYNGPVAVYVGQVNEHQVSPVTSSMPVFAVQMSQRQQNVINNTHNTNKENYRSTTITDCSQNIYKQNILNVSNMNVIDSNVLKERPWRPW